MDKITLKYIKTDSRAKTPTVAYNGTSACFDLFCVEDVEIGAGECAFVNCGIKIIIPDGYYLRFNDRSGNGIKKGLKCHMGIIDAGYSGDLAIKMWNTSGTVQKLEAGTGAIQVELLKVINKQFEEATTKEWDDYVNASERKENGFGSSNNKNKGV